MTSSLENLINQKLKKVFAEANLDTAFANIKVSDRPDLSDFQCNGALALAKQAHKNPREIATLIAAELEKDPDFAKVSVDGPGFLNLSLSNDFLAQVMSRMMNDKKIGVSCIEGEQTIVLDFGGPNAAKAMHVGHLRSGVIGEAVQRILRFVG